MDGTIHKEMVRTGNMRFYAKLPFDSRSLETPKLAKDVQIHSNKVSPDGNSVA